MAASGCYLHGAGGVEERVMRDSNYPLYLAGLGTMQVSLGSVGSVEKLSSAADRQMMHFVVGNFEL